MHKVIEIDFEPMRRLCNGKKIGEIIDYFIYVTSQLLFVSAFLSTECQF